MTNPKLNNRYRPTAQGYLPYLAVALMLWSALIPLPLNAVEIYVVNSESRTLSRIDTETDNVQPAFAYLGIIPNKFVMDEDYIWCVNSGDNAVQKISRQTGVTLSNILVETACNPWDACLGDGFLYVTGMFTNKVYKISTESNSVVGNLSVGNAPEAMCIYNGKLYVTNTGGYQNNYAGSSVSVIDLTTWQVTATIPVSANPQYIVEHAGLLHVSCTGNWVNVWGTVCVINPLNNEVIQTVNIGGSLGGLWLGSTGLGIVGDGSGVNLYRYNSTDYDIINGSDNPLPTGGSVVDGNSTMMAVLAPNWGNNGKVKLLHPDCSFWKEYNVGMAPTDLKIWQGTTPVEDEISTPVARLTAYPNPVRTGTSFRLSLAKTQASAPLTGVLSLYNLKGQLVKTQAISADKATVNTLNLPQGCYIYKLNAGGNSFSGKIAVVD